MNNERKSSGLPLLPFLIFIAIYMGAGIILQIQGVEMAFYQFPSVVAMFIAVIVGFAIHYKTGVNGNFAIFAKGAGNEDILTMLMIFLLAGAFSTVARAMGGIDSTVNLGVSIIPASMLTVGIFLISGFLSIATGSSMGTVAALVPIALGVVDKAGLNLPIVMGACLSGAMLGDNLSMISDTTIAATRTQNVELKDKFRTNFWITLPAALVTCVLLVKFGSPDIAVAIQADGYSLVKVIPYLLVLVLALIGMNVFEVLLIGIVSAGTIGIWYGDLGALEFAVKIWEGFQGMIEVFLLSMLAGGIAEMTRHYGGINWFLDKISGLFTGRKSAKVGLCFLAGLTDMATANNTVAIIVDGAMAKDISKRYKIDPRTTASILDIFSCIFQGLIPYGAQFLLIASLTKGRVSPMEVILYNWYLFLLGGFTILSFFFPAYERLTLKGKWDWDENRPVVASEK